MSAYVLTTDNPFIKIEKAGLRHPESLRKSISKVNHDLPKNAR